MSKRFWAVAILIFILSLWLRITNLNSLPIFADESIYVRWSQVMRAEAGLRFLPLSDGKQPLYMWATIPFLKIIKDPLLAARSFSALSGIGIVIGVFFLTEELFKNRRQSLMAAGIAAVLPYLVFFSRMALADSLLTMFLLWTAYFSLLSLKHHRWDWSIVAGFCLGFAWLTKSPAMFALGLLPLGIFFAKWNIKLIGYLLTTYIVGFAMYNILRLGPEFAMIAIRNNDYVFSISEILQHPLDPLIPHLKDSFMFYLYLATPVGVLLSLWGLVAGRTSLWRQRLILGVWFLLPLIAQSTIAKQFTARYLLFTVPFAVILTTIALEKIGDRTKNHILGIITGILLLIIPALIADYLIIHRPAQAFLPRIERSGYLEEWTAGTGIFEAANYIKTQPGPILVGSEGYFGTPFDALQLYLNSRSDVRVIGVGLDIKTVDSKLSNAIKDNTVFLVINSDRFSGDADKLGLKLIAQYPKALRPDRTQQWLYLFQVMPAK